MRHTFSKRNAFGAALAIGLGLMLAKLLSLFLFAGVTIAVQRLLV